MVLTEENGTTSFRRYQKEGPFDLVLTNNEHPDWKSVGFVDAICKENLKHKTGILTGGRVRQKSLHKTSYLSL